MGKTALIVTDGDDVVQTMAETAARALRNGKPEGCAVTVLRAADFEGTLLLAADLCFFGAGAANPPSFARLNAVLAHINLAGRRGGVFSPSGPAVEYLEKTLQDSELALPAGSFRGEGDIGAWAEKIAFA
jgi:hypothetical protein